MYNVFSHLVINYCSAQDQDVGIFVETKSHQLQAYVCWLGKLGKQVVGKNNVKDTSSESVNSKEMAKLVMIKEIRHDCVGLN